MMPFDPNIHHRRSTRLAGYDYSQEGAYFVTICTYAKQWQFGDVQNDVMILNQYGQIANSCWLEIPSHFPQIELDAFVIMPNHMHGIIVITESPSNVGAQHVAPSKRHFTSSNKKMTPNVKAGSLSAAMRSYKAAVTRQVNRLYHAPGEQLWQRNFHDHIIRNHVGLNHLRTYVINNPASWSKDSLWSANS